MFLGHLCVPRSPLCFKVTFVFIGHFCDPKSYICAVLSQENEQDSWRSDVQRFSAGNV